MKCCTKLTRGFTVLNPYLCFQCLNTPHVNADERNIDFGQCQEKLSFQKVRHTMSYYLLFLGDLHGVVL